jgi:hypothetical protein
MCDSSPDPRVAALSNIVPTISDPPVEPPYRAVTDYFDFGDTKGISGISIGLSAPLKYDVPPGYNLRFFAYANGTWVDLKPAVSDGSAAASTFDPLPSNLIVLAVPVQ